MIDSMGMWENLDREFLNGRGIPATPEYTARVGAMSFREAAEYTIRKFGFQDTPEEMMAKWSRMVREQYARHIGLKPHAREYLELLKKRGVALGVATALPEELSSPVLKRNGVFDWFQAFATVEEAGRGKKYPDIYLLAAKKLRVPPNKCAVFEDVLPAVEGAKAAGMTVIAVYDAHSHADEKAMRGKADRYIRGYSELLWDRQNAMRDPFLERECRKDAGKGLHSTPKKVRMILKEEGQRKS